MNAAALMTADQYRANAERFVLAADDKPLRDAEIFVAIAQVYALLAISAQAAENATDLPF